MLRIALQLRRRFVEENRHELLDLGGQRARSLQAQLFVGLPDGHGQVEVSIEAEDLLNLVELLRKSLESDRPLGSGRAD